MYMFSNVCNIQRCPFKKSVTCCLCVRVLLHAIQRLYTQLDDE